MSAIGADPAPETYPNSVEHRSMLSRYALATGSVVQSLVDNAPFLNVRDYGAEGDGTTNDDEAFTAAATAAAAAGVEVFIPDTGSDYILTSQPAIGTFWGTGSISVSGTGGYVKPHPGTATAIYAQGFGIPTGESTDAQPLLQEAVDYAQSLDLPLELEPRVIYRVDSSVVIPQGRVTGEVFADTREFTLEGNFAEIRPRFNGAALDIQPVCTLAMANTTSALKLGQVVVRNLNFNFATANSNSLFSSYAIQIGRAGYTMRDTEVSVIENVRIKDRNQTNFTVNAVQIVNASMWRFDSLVVVNGGVSITNTDNDTQAFTGDLWFNDCDLRGSNVDGKRPVHIFGNDTDSATLANIAAIWFSNCEIYEGGCKIEAAAGDVIRRIWFNGTHFAETEAGHRVIEIEVTDAGGATNPGFMDEIVFDNCLFPQTQGSAGGRMIHATADAASAVHALQIKGCRFRDAQPTGGDVEVIYLENIDHAQILGNSFTDMQMTGSVITCEDCDGTVIQGNVVPDSGGLFPANAHFVEMGANSNEWNVTGNSAAINGTGVMVNSSAGAGTEANNQVLTT